MLYRVDSATHQLFLGYSHLAWAEAKCALDDYDLAVKPPTPHFLLKRDLSAYKAGAHMICRLDYSGLTL